jgi:cyclopropane-fatty-acyl-phospholipid synthase
MTLIESAIKAVERLPLPDSLTRAGVAFLVSRTARRLAVADPAGEERFARAMADYPVAIHTADANAQHYEVPAAFFGHFLGPHRKYSCCLYEGAATLGDAEAAALEATVARAGLADGQRILELGCGWGSLSLFMAARYPNARITAVSNSTSQRARIEEQAAERGLANLTVITADMNAFEGDGRFDRIISVEMFEHMSNWELLLARVHRWLEVEGRLFIHIFTHAHASYRFDQANKSDWIAQHFFTGGIMPGHGLIRHFPHLFEVEEEWRWNGRHYERTALDWLAHYDHHIAEIRPILADIYGRHAGLWERRWRLFLLATAGLFGHGRGEVWGVSHYRLRPV